MLAAAVTSLALLAAPPAVRPVSVPPTAVVGAPWRVAVSVRPQAPVVLEARIGAARLRARARPTQRRGVHAATFRLPRAGTWTLSAIVRGRLTRLGSVAVDVRRSPLVLDPISIAADSSGALVVGQLRRGALLRVAGGRVTTLASGIGVYHVSTAGNDVYGAGRDGAVYRADNGALRRASPVVDANAVVADAAGNLYVTVYAGWVKKVAPDGTISTLAGDGTEGFAGDGGPARAAKLNHPHALALGRDGALYVADTENRRVRRIDLATGRISSFGGDVGVTVSVSVAPDGSVYSADLARNGRPGGVTRTTAGVTRRVLSSFSANGVAVAPNGAVYVNFADERRIGRLDVSSGRVTPVARG